LEAFTNPYGLASNYSDEIDVKKIIKTALMVEDESRQIK
jgi:hypothetical protein